MSDLEGMGMVKSPHSAGRVPTIKGYRFFVDTLLTVESMKLHEVRYIQNALSIDAPENHQSGSKSTIKFLSLLELSLPRENVNPSGNWSF